jgi:hypothetical protein
LVRPEAVNELASALSHWARERPLDLPQRLDLHLRLATRFSLMAPILKIVDLYQQLLAGTVSASC